jgi:putative ABC transport system permease protein
MSRFMGLRHRLRALLFPRAHAQDIADEMELHLDLERMHQGDHREAAVRFGNRTYYQEEVRRMTWYGALDGIRQDARYAWRSMRRSKGFTLMVVITLALGVGLNAASFSLLDLVFMHKPSGITRPDDVRQFHIQYFNTGDGVPYTTTSMSHLTYLELGAALGDTSKLALYATDNALRMGKHPRDPRIRGVYASANYFSVLGVRPALGRLYAADEDQLGKGVPVAVVSHRFWRTHLGGEPSAIGRTVNVEGTKYTVVGVLDPAFGGVDLQASDIWMPLATIPVPKWIKGPWWKEPFNMTRFHSLFRAEPGMSEPTILARATARVRALEVTLSPKRPDLRKTVYAAGFNGGNVPVKPGSEMLISSRLSGVAIIVLLVALANVVNLLLARAVRRRHEVSIRLALGVSRARLLRMHTVETVLLALVATIPALLAAWWGGSMLRNLMMPNVEWYDAAITWRVVAFAFGIALLAGLVAGVVPAFQSSSPDLLNALKSSTRTGGYRSRVRNALVITQAALTLVLLTGSALFVRSLRNVQSIDIGFDASRLLFGSTQFAEGESPPPAVADAALRDIETRLSGKAGVVSTARTWMEPMQGIAWVDWFTVRDSSAGFRENSPTVSNVTPGFFSTVGMRITRGRTFSGTGNGGALPEVIVNEALAARLWPNANPLGQCMQFKKRGSACHTVVGVTENARQNSVIEEQTAFQFYRPLDDRAGPGSRSIVIVLRVDGSPAAATTALRRELLAAFPAGEPEIHTMMENLEPEYRPWQLGASLFSGVGVLALVVALIGIYSTVSYGVAQRTHEFGVRIALGAQLRDLVRQVVGEGVRMVLVGTVVGVMLALAAGRFVASLLYDVNPRDPVTMALVAAAMLVAAASAAVVPAWRASRVDPTTALRAE